MRTERTARAGQSGWRALPVGRLGLACLMVWGWADTAAALDDARAVQAAREALARPGSYPWYDASADDVRARPLKTQPQPEGPQWWSAPAPGRTWRWPSARGFWRGLGYVVWFALALLLVVLIYLFIRSYRRREDEMASRLASHSHQVGTKAQRIELLPFELRTDDLDLLAQARRAYADGDYERAIVYLFSHLLVELDRAHLIRLTKGKTNRQYLAELRGRGQLRSILEVTMVAFEEVFFGQRRLGKTRFDRCWSLLGRFEHLVQQPAAGDVPA